MSKNHATWSISLDVECPSCEHYFDMLEGDDFWHNNQLKPIEHGTEASRDVEATCPECEHEFLVDLEY